jgi:uncharacterized protein YqhQ
MAVAGGLQGGSEDLATTASPSGEFFYGGQAVVEGVMMRGRDRYAVAVRLPQSGEILVHRGELRSHLYRHLLWRLPFARGLAMVAEQLHLGMRSLIWATRVNAGAQDVEIGTREIGISLAVAVALSVGIFFGLPLVGAGLAIHRTGSLGFVLVEALIRIGLVVGYLLLVGLLPEVRRLFQYHGAEHKTVNALEAGWPLDPEHVRPASTLHPRCGTGFLLVVLVVSLFVFSLVAVFNPDWVGVVVSRLVGIPVVAALAYEAIRWLARHRRSPVAWALLQPVLATQRLTTREPDDGMLEVAIAALEAAREGEPVPGLQVTGVSA